MKELLSLTITHSEQRERTGKDTGKKGYGIIRFQPLRLKQTYSIKSSAKRSTQPNPNTDYSEDLSIFSEKTKLIKHECNFLLNKALDINYTHQNIILKVHFFFLALYFHLSFNLFLLLD